MTPSTATGDDRIFVQIAAYRDQELVPTLRDCIAQAETPEKLVFGICWQHDDDDSLEEFSEHDQVRLISMHHSESRGACWARQQTQQLYRNEQFTLQIDSHHRFTRGWDSALKQLFYAALKRGSQKPLITSYAPVYEPGADGNSRGKKPLRLVFDQFNEGGPVQVKPVELEAPWPKSGLEKARFLSAHFLFTLGSFCQEVPYDPRMYFFGEEPSLAIRAFTHGYDLYHPCEVLLWHFYGRSTYARHWSDNKRWWLRNERSLLRYRRLVEAGGESQDLGEFGLGAARSLKEYERYAGLSLAHKQVAAHTLAGKPPTAGQLPWRKHKMLPENLLRIRFEESSSPLKSPETIDHLLITAWCKRGRELGYRILENEPLKQFLAGESHTLVIYTQESPDNWSATPWSQARGWGEVVRGDFLSSSSIDTA